MKLIMFFFLLPIIAHTQMLKERIDDQFKDNYSFSTIIKHTPNSDFNFLDSINYTNNDLDSEKKFSSHFLMISIGASEIMSIGTGYNWDRHNSLGIKININIVDESQISDYGVGFGMEYLPITVGLRYSYSFYFINGIYLSSHLTFSPYFYKSVFKASQTELTIGYCGDMEKGIYFIYELGFSYFNPKESRSHFYPSYKIGLQHNF